MGVYERSYPYAASVAAGRAGDEPSATGAVRPAANYGPFDVCWTAIAAAGDAHQYLRRGYFRGAVG